MTQTVSTPKLVGQDITGIMLTFDIKVVNI